MTTFSEVKTVLDGIIANWTAGNGSPPHLQQRHNPSDPTGTTTVFAWDTRAKLLVSQARGLQLIQPDVIGKKGSGQNANIVAALTTGAGGFPRMPFGGLDSNNGVFLKPDSTEIQTLVSWIEEGCPGDNAGTV
jgi:hypothetical protein